MENDNDLVQRTEEFAKNAFGGIATNLSIAHDFKHVDRVRNWALVIARGENYTETELIEITALLHDIGLTFIKDGSEKTTHVKLPPHGPLGADIAGKFLEDNSTLPTEKIEQITDVIRHHSSPPLIVEERLAALGEKRKLMEIVRDADIMDGLGAAGLMRAFTSKYFLPEYDAGNIKGNGWGLSAVGFQARFGFDPKQGLAPVNTIIDQVNQQIRSYEDNLHTDTARKLAEPLVAFMKDFIIQLENEILHSRE